MSETQIKKQALLIGINQYAILPELKYARQDAEAVDESLKMNYSFSDNEIMLLTDAKPGLFKPLNKHIIQTHLENLAGQELDLFIFGFWGHGLFRNGKRYLCPLDVMDTVVEEQGISFNELQQLIANIRAKNTCMILDCCQTIHDRGESEKLTVDDQSVMENVARDIVLKRKEQMPDFQSNVIILNSCREGQSAYEWDTRQHGIFTAHLLDAFSHRYQSVSQIVGYLSSNVQKTALELGKIQTPYSKLEGDIILPVKTESAPLVTGDVFISYRHCNVGLVASIEEELKKRGISYFIDREGINYGMDFFEAIAQAIKKCKVLLLVWTQDANDSSDIVREVKLALDLKKTVIPYKVGTFDVVDHNALYYQLAPISRYEVNQQTQESVVEIVNRIELALAGVIHTPVATVSVSRQNQNDPQHQTQITSDPLLKKTLKTYLTKLKEINGNKFFLVLCFFLAAFFIVFVIKSFSHNQIESTLTPDIGYEENETGTIENEPSQEPVKINMVDSIIENVVMLEKEGQYQVARKKLLTALQEDYSDKLVDLWIQLDTKLCRSYQNYKNTLSVFTPEERTWTEAGLKYESYNKWNPLNPIGMIIGKGSEEMYKKMEKERFDKDAAKDFGMLGSDSIVKTLESYDILKQSIDSLLSYINTKMCETNDSYLSNKLCKYSNSVKDLKNRVKEQRTVYLSYCVVSPYLADAERWLYLANEQKEWLFWPQKEVLDKAIMDFKVLSFSCNGQHLCECKEDVRKQFIEVQNKLKSMVSSAVYEELKFLTTLQDSSDPSKKRGADAWWE